MKRHAELQSETFGLGDWAVAGVKRQQVTDETGTTPDGVLLWIMRSTLTPGCAS
jgi:hypothetical protein